MLKRAFLLAMLIVALLLIVSIPMMTISAAGTNRIGMNGNYNYFIWPNQVPTGCPLSLSSDYTYITFTGRWADYSNADTWYPSWGSDGNLYSPFTDGSCGGVSAGSPNPGQAQIVGDDPLNLDVYPSAVTNSNGGGGTNGYGRYPSASLMYNNIWYYGTYLLTGPDNSLSIPHWDWPVLEPFVGFRYSTNNGVSWTDNTNPNNCLFENYHYSLASGSNNEDLIGAPHMVDFGKNLQYAPTDPSTGRKYAYMVAHGADAGATVAQNDWIMGDNIYLLRILMPSGTDAASNTAYLNTAANWQYYSIGGTWRNWNRSNLTDVYNNIQPIVDWNGHLGNVALTYNAPLNRYLMCLSRCNSTSSFDTMILESNSITGPYKVVHYLPTFGQVGYFTNIPSKFISADGRTMWLSYSANYTGAPSNIEHAAYSWCLNEFVLSSGPTPTPMPLTGKVEAENGTKSGGAANYADSYASGGYNVAYLNTIGSSVSFNNCVSSTQIIIQYATVNTGSFSLYLNGAHSRDINFTSTGAWYGSGAYRTTSVPVSIPQGATVKLQCDSGDVGINIDYIVLSNDNQNNVAPLATVSVSSVYSGYSGPPMVDGVVDGYPGDISKEWASNGEKVGAWATLTWSGAKTINKISLYDRPNNYDQVTSGTLTFSDGSSVNVGVLPDTDKSAATVTFANKTVTWVKFTVDSVKSGSLNIGLAEFEVFEAGGGSTPTPTPTPAPTSAGLIGYWRLDETSGTSAADSSGNNKTGTVSGAVWTAGHNGNSLDFDGTNDYLSILDAFDPTTTTISAWIKPHSVSNTNIICRTDSAGPTQNWSHQIRITSGGKLEAYTYDHTGGGKSVTGTTTLTTNTWYHVAMTIKNGGQIKLYVNGQPEGTAQNITTMWVDGDRYYVGSNAGGNHGFPAIGWFDGLIDEVKLFDRELTQSEIQALMN